MVHSKQIGWERAKKEKDKFETFWNNFGPVLKEGLYEHNDQIGRAHV